VLRFFAVKSNSVYREEAKDAKKYADLILYYLCESAFLSVAKLTFFFAHFAVQCTLLVGRKPRLLKGCYYCLNRSPLQTQPNP
jgi:hypothetical protein